MTEADVRRSTLRAGRKHLLRVQQALPKLQEQTLNMPLLDRFYRTWEELTFPVQAR